MKVTIDEKKKQITIVIDMNSAPYPASGSGKTLLVASERSKEQTSIGSLTTQVNCYIPNKQG